MRSTPLALILFAALPCVGQDAWTLDGKHVVAVRASGASEAEAKAAAKELTPWVRARVQAAKTPQVFVVSADSAATLVADLQKAGHALVERKGDLRALSPGHTEVYETLEDLGEGFRGPGRKDFASMRKLETELIERLQAEEGLAGPVCDVLLFSENKFERVFLAKTLAGLALGRPQEVVLTLPETALVVSLARSLPKGPKSLALLQRAFPRQPETSCKTVLLREIGSRVGPKDDAGFLRTVAADTKAARGLRAEAITILGRRENPADFETLAPLCKKGEAVLRYRAIVAAASSGGAKALPLLKELRQDEEIRLRAAVVLALGMIGTKEARGVIEEIAKDDPSEAVRQRAQRLLASLKKAEEKE